MVAKLEDVLLLLNEIAPISLAEDWDNPGLQVGDPSQEIRKIFIALDPTIQSIRDATHKNADLLLTHHPLLFQPLLHLSKEVYPGDVIFEAIGQGVSIVSVHTNLDVSPNGINTMLADLFGLLNTEVLQEREHPDGNGTTGLGRIGDLPETVTLSAMAEKVKKALGSSHVMIFGGPEREIRRVAVVGGAGGRYISDAHENGADLFITGDITHHQALETQARGMALMDGGHFYTEKAALIRFAQYFSRKLEDHQWHVAVEVYGDERAPMRFL